MSFDRMDLTNMLHTYTVKTDTEGPLAQAIADLKSLIANYDAAVARAFRKLESDSADIWADSETALLEVRLCAGAFSPEEAMQQVSEDPAKFGALVRRFLRGTSAAEMAAMLPNQEVMDAEGVFGEKVRNLLPDFLAAHRSRVEHEKAFATLFRKVHPYATVGFTDPLAS